MIYFIELDQTTNYKDFEKILPSKLYKDALLKKNDLDRLSKSVGYLLLIKALKDHNINDLPIIEYNKYGKPYLKNYPNLYYNISHKVINNKLYLCLALEQEEVGIDLEVIKDYKDNLIKYCCNDEEYSFIINSTNINKEFAVLWTKKESYLKYIGTGITKDLKNCLINNNGFFETEIIKDSIVITICKKNKNI